MLPQRRLEVPHLPLDGLGELENPSGQQRRVLPKDDLEEGSRNPARVGHDVVHVRLKREGVDSAPGDVRLKQDVHLAVDILGAASDLKEQEQY